MRKSGWVGTCATYNQNGAKKAPESAISRSAKELFSSKLGTYRFRQRGVAERLFSFSSGNAILYTESRTGFDK